MITFIPSTSQITYCMKNEFNSFGDTYFIAINKGLLFGSTRVRHF